MSARASVMLKHFSLLRRLSLVALAALVGAAGVLALVGAAQAEAPGEDFSLSLSLVPVEDGNHVYIAPAADTDNVVAKGEEYYVQGEVRYVGDAFLNRFFPEDGLRYTDFRMTLSGNLDWANGRSQLIMDQVLPDLGELHLPEAPIVNPYADMETIAPDGSFLPNLSRVIMKAWDERTIIGAGEAPWLYVYDLYTKRQVAIIEAPEGADRGAAGFGSSRGGARGGWAYNAHNGRAIAVWHETDDDDIAWIFVGSPSDNVIEGGQTRRLVGALHVYKLDWSTTPPTITYETKLQPPISEAGNTNLPTSDHNYRANYGSSVDISADGSTLAVAAHGMNIIGAIYVYTQPAGGWGDLSYDEGVKVSAAEIPSLGSTYTEMPFTPGATGSTDAATDCNSYCANFWRHYLGGLGSYRVSLSADGTVLAAGAPYTRYGAHAVKSDMHPEGTASAPPNPRTVKWWSGEAYVWVAPTGGWNMAADATVDAQGNAKTVIAAKQNANLFRPATHVSPGPKKRITEPTATFVRRATYGALNNDVYWAYWAEVSLDGSLIFVGSGGGNGQAAAGQQPYGGQYNDHRGPGELAIFERPGGGWAALTTPKVGDAVINGLTWGIGNPAFGGWGAPGQGGIALNADSSRIIVGMPNDHQADFGQIRLFKRPDGGWAGGGLAATQAFFGPPDINGPAGAYQEPIWQISKARRTRSFGMVLQNLNRDRVLVSAIGTRHYDGPGGWGHSNGPGRVYFDDAGCTSELVDGRRVNTCPFIMHYPGRFLVPTYAEDGKYTISASMKVQLGDDTERAVPLSASLEFEVGTVKHVDSASLEFASDDRGTADTGDDRPYPSSIAKGESTQLRLQILNDRGKQSDFAEVETIIARTTRGRLSAMASRRISSYWVCRNTAICRINGAALDDKLPGEIVLTLDYSGAAEAGPADVEVTVISTQGDLADTEPLRVTFAGAPASLSMTAPTTGVLGVDTPDAGDDDVAADEVDNRDVLKLSVSAADANGAKVSPPATGRAPSWTVTGPDGARVTRGLSVAWPLGGRESPTLDDDRNWQVELNVDRSAAERLPNGEYTLTVTAGALSAEQTFTVTGGAAAVSLGEPIPTPAVGASFTIAAEVRDSEGAAVPNGTRVTWAALGLVEDVISIVQTSAQSVTREGTATATYLVVAPGASTITAGSPGATSDVARIGVADASAPAAPSSPAESLSSTLPGAPSSWLGDASIQASDLLASLEGVSSVLLWQYTKWIRYTVVDGRVAPGSFDFQVQPGDVLWLGG